MQFEWPALSAVAAVAGVLGVGGRALFERIMGRAITDHNVVTKIRDARVLADNALTTAQAVGGKIELLRSEFQDHRVEDARNFSRLEAYASQNSHAIADAETRLADAMEHIARQIGSITERMDNFLLHVTAKK